MKKHRVVALVREGLIPPASMEGYSDEEIAHWKVEYDVITTLRELGHDVLPVGVYDDLAPLRRALDSFQPHIVFMLLEEFHGMVAYDHAIVSYLELLRQPYTGCNPRGLFLSRDKALTKTLLAHHRIATPRFAVFPLHRQIKRTRRLSFPLLVKSVTEDASEGISEDSVVHDDAALAQRVRYIHETLHCDAMAEQFIEGRELYVGIVGNQRLHAFPVWEMDFSHFPETMPQIATASVKWDPDFQKKYGIDTFQAKGLSREDEENIVRTCKRVYRLLSMSVYGRIDLRFTPKGRAYVLEANANPNLEDGEDFAESAEAAGISYSALIQRILNLGLRYGAPWKSV